MGGKHLTAVGQTKSSQFLLAGSVGPLVKVYEEHEQQAIEHSIEHHGSKPGTAGFAGGMKPPERNGHRKTAAEHNSDQHSGAPQ